MLTIQREDIGVSILLNEKGSLDEKGSPAGKVADAELHFTAGPLSGLKLIGFSVWERRDGSGRNVTFPARQYSVNGEGRSFAVLRPIIDTGGRVRVRDLILDACALAEEQAGRPARRRPA